MPEKSLYGYLNPSPGRAISNPRGSTLARLAEAVGVSEQFLRFGEAVIAAADLPKVPLIDMDKLGTLKPKHDPRSLWDKVSYVSADQHVPDKCFAVQVADESGLPEFHEGETLIIDPSAQLIPGRLVVVVMQDDQRVIFGRYKPKSHGDHKRFTITVPNPAYPEIEFGGANSPRGFIIGRVVKHTRNL